MLGICHSREGGDPEMNVTADVQSLMIKFNCPNCGQKLRVPENRAGKKGKCPKCKNSLLIPDSQTVADLLTPDAAAQIQEPAEHAPYKLTFLDDLPKPSSQIAPTQDNGEPDLALLDAQASLLGWKKSEPEPLPERKLPWIIDIFLYPVNTSGLTIIAIATVLPFILHALTKFLSIFTMTFPPGVIFLVLILIIRFLLGITLFFYLWWYLTECIRDSALGGLRAPETAGSTPNFGEMICIVFRIIACVAVALAPAIVYLIYTRRIDITLWILYGCGAFVFPMAWLAVTMFDSVGALNPILLIPSILSTFFRYLALAFFYYMPALAIPLLIFILPRNWAMDHLLKLIGIYLSMVTSHLLGRFYFRAREKLNWEV